MDPLLIQPADSFGPATSMIWVLIAGCCTIGLFAFSTWRFLVYRGRALRAESMAQQPQTLENGPALISGRVETDDGGPAVRIEIDQLGTETKNKNGWSHRWEEKNRTVHVRPFRVRLANQEAVTVVPDDRIRLVDALETERFEGNYRRRVAELTSKELIWVSGVLTQEGQKGTAGTAYRSVPGSLVLRGTRMEPLEVAAGSLDTQFAYWRRFYATAAGALGVVSLVVHGLVFMPFYALAFTGKVQSVQITNTSTYVTTSKNSRVTHYVVHGMLASKTWSVQAKDDVSFTVYDAAKSGRLQRAPFIYAPAMPSVHSIGTHADLSYLRAGIGAFTAAVTVFLFFVSRNAAMPWYEQKKVREVGSDRLELAAWRAQIPGKPGLYEERPEGGKARG